MIKQAKKELKKQGKEISIFIPVYLIVVIAIVI